MRAGLNEISSVAEFARVFRRLQGEIHKVIVGHQHAVEDLLIALFAGGHVLIEGVPGTGKTVLVKTLARALNLSFSRIQFTVDLMPADITGTRVIDVRDDGRREFSFAPGPIFTHVLLADEINRSTPKTQSALLEAMAELQVTVAGQTRALKPPFFVMATLNPVEMEGTYPLPEAQLDRFFFKIRLDFPNESELTTIISSTTGPDEPTVEPVFAAEEATECVESLKRLVREVIVSPEAERFAARLVGATQPSNSKFTRGKAGSLRDDFIDRYIAFGSSPRGGQTLILGAKVAALLDGRVNVAYEDIRRVALSALNHRIMLNYAAQADAIEPEHLIERVLEAPALRRG
jgi:MoxR-like ATPase